MVDLYALRAFNILLDDLGLISREVGLALQVVVGRLCCLLAVRYGVLLARDRVARLLVQLELLQVAVWRLGLRALLLSIFLMILVNAVFSIIRLDGLFV
jgi:hypothetical protein